MGQTLACECSANNETARLDRQVSNSAKDEDAASMARQVSSLDPKPDPEKKGNMAQPESDQEAVSDVTKPESPVEIAEQTKFKYLVVGGGVAAGYTCRELVEKGVGPGMIGVICAESVCPYERPALSKAYLHHPGAKVRARLPGFHTCVGSGGERQDPKWYQDKGVHILHGKATDVNFSERMIETHNGKRYTYDKLFLATGSRANHCGLPGSNAEGVYHVREEQDFASLVAKLESLNGCGNVVCVGASYIGLETAAAMLGWGVHVTVLSDLEILIPRQFNNNKDLSEWLEERLTARGITFIKNNSVVEFQEEGGHLTGAKLADGTVVPCTVAVVGVGAQPNIEFLKNRLATAKGAVKVNNQLQTSDANTYALGDICVYPSSKDKDAEYKRHGQVDFARKTAAHAAQHALGMELEPFSYLQYSYTRMFEYTDESVGYIFFGQSLGVKKIVTEKPNDHTIWGVYLVDGHVAGAIIMSSPTPLPSLNDKLRERVAARPKFTKVNTFFAGIL